MFKPIPLFLCLLFPIRILIYRTWVFNPPEKTIYPTIVDVFLRLKLGNCFMFIEYHQREMNMFG